MSKISIKLDDDSNWIRTIYRGIRQEDEWIQIDESELPEITEDNVSVKYFYDAENDTITAETTKNEDTELL